ncbi:calcium-binding protein PBP1-like isoform X2 [Durio zibethinus]|uniref:Calcium-binding protein PBP1-like isoform X2 n=1 Tax=Durio zibethinus TaxID=66656 RepID=A0A6P5Z9B7_DURZI|nr:calcium-binding protein PBP1-like isoform X2 [Durio zibethinus]
MKWIFEEQMQCSDALSSREKKMIREKVYEEGLDFEDLLPVMAEKLGGEGLIRELCNGFNLLMDKDKGVITLESLKMNAASLRLQDLRDEEIVSMIREGDLDGDDALNEMEFCVLMFRLSPGLMEESQLLLEEILEDELNTAGF